LEKNEMKKIALAFFLLSLMCALSVFAQTGKKTRPRIVPEAPTPTPETPSTRPELKNSPEETDSRKPPVLVDNSSKKPPTDGTAVDDDEVVEGSDEEIVIETNFVTLPVSVLDRNGRFVAGLMQNDFQIYENNVLQKVEYFASVEKPFTVVLLIDVSPSTQYKIDEIHRAAISFVNQLRPEDQVMVVAFDEGYQMLARPTSNRAVLEAAIRRANFGSGTSLYDSVSRTITRELRQFEGRKAIVLFTDGVDTTSRLANYESTIRQVEEVDALIYPIRYDTYGQYAGGGGRTTTRRIPRTGSVLGDILGAIITGGQSTTISVGSAGTSAEEYERGKQYLGELARFSGGRKFEADTINNLDSAFRSIAEELRRQYSLGYYPDTGETGERRRIRVRVKRPDLVVRTKTSYIVGSGR
jgi:Ca-activated chloride channel homolog